MFSPNLNGYLSEGLADFSDNNFSDTKFSETEFLAPNLPKEIFRHQICRQTNFPKPHFPKDIFSDNQNYNQLIIEPNLT